MSNLQQTARRMVWMRHIPGFQAWNRLFFRREYPSLSREVFGIRFAHPLGLAPVLDRQADLLDECDSLGFSFSGIIPEKIPFQTLAQRLQGRKTDIRAAIELRADGASEDQARDSLIRTYSLLYDFADFFVVDVNRQTGQTSFDDISDWSDILDELLSLRLCYERYTPIILRLPPGQTEGESRRMLDFCLLSGIDGVVVSGAEQVSRCVRYTKDRLPIIGSGAISSSEEALSLLHAGASLIEVAQGIPSCGRSTSRRILQAIEKNAQPLP
jgi:dihydroorotate dehydrogenase